MTSERVEEFSINGDELLAKVRSWSMRATSGG